MHWIPSHIENTEYGKVQIEDNFRAINLQKLQDYKKEMFQQLILISFGRTIGLICKSNF